MSRLSPEQAERYQAHLALPEVGVEGQSRLLEGRVLLVGVGGLGCPVALYLTAAGVGTLGLVDDDVVDRTNLQRQVLFGPDDVGEPKVERARDRLRAVNPDVRVETEKVRLTASNAGELVEGWDVVVDGSDNFATRYVVNDAAVLAGVPLVTGSIYQFEGQATVIQPPLGPCYRCLFRSPAPDQPACRDAGVLATLPGVVGTIQATEALKLLLGQPSSLLGRLLLVDLREGSFRSVRVKADPECPLCGDRPTITRPTAVAAAEAAG